MKEIIIHKMQEKNISQNKLAELVGVKQQYISKILLGKVESPSF
ncbi:helix-turn-helix domain-containing protein, partial [Lactococcus fujiensis]